MYCNFIISRKLPREYSISENAFIIIHGLHIYSKNAESDFACEGSAFFDLTRINPHAIYMSIVSTFIKTV